jgi:RNA polymerase sigma factor (sigma-70 family)
VTWPEGKREQKALLDRVMPMVKKLAKKRARLGRVMTEDECLDVARWAAEDAIATYDREKGELLPYVHAKVDQALLNAVAKRRRRESSPMLKMLRGIYDHARGMQQRGDLMHDSEEETLRHLQDAGGELSATFGLRLAASTDETVAASREAQAVRGALDEMPPYEKEILWGRLAEEQTLEEIAAATRTSTATVHRDVPKALRRLTALLRRKGVGETLSSG